MDAKKIGQRLRELRGDRKQSEVARAADIAITALSMYEGGKRIPTDGIKIRLAEYFDVSVGALFFNEGGHK